MRILLLFEPPDGGVPQVVRRLATGFSERGHEVWVAGRADAVIRDAIERAGIRYVPLPIEGSVPAPRPDVRVLRGIGRLLRAAPFDVVHTHGQKAGLLGRPVAARHRVPSLYSPHSFVYRTQAARNRRGTALRGRANLAVERVLGRGTAAIVACSAEEGAAAISDRIVPAERVEVVLHGVDPDTEAAADPELDAFAGEDPLFGFVAGLRDQKGLPTLLDALELLRGRGRAPRFAIVGNGDLHGYVEDRLRQSGLSETTLLSSYAGRPEPYLAALDAFVLPSYWEGMPTAVLEAMAMGVPVVASDVGGTAEAVEEGRTGLVVPPLDPAALADAIAALHADADLRAEMSAAASEAAARRFGVPRMLDDTEALYRRVTGKASGAAAGVSAV